MYRFPGISLMVFLTVFAAPAIICYGNGVVAPDCSSENDCVEKAKTIEDNAMKIQYLGKALEFNPGSASALFDRGTELIRAGEFTSSIKDFDLYLDINPNNGMAWLSRGYAYEYRGKNEEALRDFNRAIELDPSNPEFYLSRAILYRTGLKHFVNADADLDMAVKVDPEYALAYYLKGLWMMDSIDTMGQMDALPLFDKAIELDPSDADAYYKRGTVYNNIGDREKALEDFNKTIELAPARADARKDRAAILLINGQYDLAIQDYDRIIELLPGADAHNDRGGAYLMKKDYDRAIADFEKAIELDPEGQTGQWAKKNLERALKEKNSK